MSTARHHRLATVSAVVVSAAAVTSVVVLTRAPTVPPPTPIGPSSATASYVLPTAPATSTAPGGPLVAPSGIPPASDAQPDATNTGVPAGTTLTVVNGDQTFGPSSDGQTISGKEFRGFVRVTGAGITLKDSIFRGRETDSNTGLLDTESASGTTIVQNSEFVPSDPSATIDCIWANNTVIDRANIHGCVDGVKTGSDVLIQNSYIHDMARFDSDPNQGGGETHNDGVQSFVNASNITLRHNTIVMNTTTDNAALQTSANNTHIEDNWLTGGGCTLNFAHNILPSLTGIHIVNNRFGPSFFDCPILISTRTTISRNSGNTWNDGDAPIPPPQQHD